MKILGFSLTSLLILLAFFWAGTKFPNTFGNIPILGK